MSSVSFVELATIIYVLTISVNLSENLDTIAVIQRPVTSVGWRQYIQCQVSIPA